MLVAGCYSEPDIEIAVTRSEQSVPVDIRVCASDDTNMCRGNRVFLADSDELERKVFVFVDNGARDVVLKLFGSTDMDWQRCVRIQLLDETLIRSLDIEDLSAENAWGCVPATPCELVEDCL
ncbi:MAG TPA: hypothetical protein VIV11_10320 [Kofleriaceae bacterium]